MTKAAWGDGEEKEEKIREREEKRMRKTDTQEWRLCHTRLQTTVTETEQVFYLLVCFSCFFFSILFMTGDTAAAFTCPMSNPFCSIVLV